MNEVEESDFQLEYVGFWPRLGANIIDGVILSFITFPVLIAAYGFDYFVSDELVKGPVDILMSYIFPAVFVVALWIYKQATPGKMVVAAKIVDAKTGGKPTVGQFILRYFGYIISTVPLCLGYLWIAIDDRKQAWHDKIAGTVVIRPVKRVPQAVTFAKTESGRELGESEPQS